MHKIMAVYEALYEAYGPQKWWPASSDLEMMLGAILVQNTSWHQVEKALENLPHDANAIAKLPIETLETMIRAAGSYKRKAQSIQAFALYYLEIGCDPKRLDGERLLEIHGIGKETRDCMLLYAKHEPVFVVDTYLKRLLASCKIATFKTYDAYQTFMEKHCTKDLEIYQEFHALIVAYGKRKKTDDDPLEAFKNPIFEISNEGLDFVKHTDPKMKKLVDHYGVIKRPVMCNVFDAITYTIIGQLVSVKAAQSIQARFDAVYQWPADVVAVSVETVKSVGLTQNKAKAIHAIAHMFENQEVDIDLWHTMPEAQLVKTLTKLPGIGDWSARMIMIHGLNRENVTSYDDVAIRRGVCMTYGLESIDRDAFNAILETFSPYRTIASIYFWAMSKEDEDTKTAILSESLF